ncbi:MAG TPA: hypothetical protein VFW38_04955 [Solirubrobacteraceae bacterium]|nr:hypothetical protein [Solirubrobacteraceae bacterium]
MSFGEAPIGEGWCEQELRSELPDLALLAVQVRLAEDCSPRSRPPVELAARLRDLANGWRGARVVALRKQPVPSAYRAFYRQVGLDPDSTRTAIEELVLARMIAGDFRSSGLLADALALALLDTSVPVWAVDAETIDGPLGVRPSRKDELIERGSKHAVLGGGRLVVADAERAVALLFDQPQRPHRATRSTRLLSLYAIEVAGVPRLCVEEALSICAAALADRGLSA